MRNQLLDKMNSASLYWPNSAPRDIGVYLREIGGAIVEEIPPKSGCFRVRIQNEEVCVQRFEVPDKPYSVIGVAAAPFGKHVRAANAVMDKFEQAGGSRTDNMLARCLDVIDGKDPRPPEVFAWKE